MSIKFLVRLLVCTCGILVAGNLFVFGTLDLNNNGKSEILLLGGLSNQLEYVELGDEGSHRLLWTYSPGGNGKIVDARFSDLNNDGTEELVVVLQSNNNNWLSVFEWNGQTFSSNPKSIMGGNGKADIIRPGNLAGSANVFAVSMSTPTRSAELFTLFLEEGSLHKSNNHTISGALVNNGYGPVYVGVFSSNLESFVALMSPEGDGLKTSVFSTSNLDEELASDLLVMNGARVVLGQYIQPFDENKDGVDELLIPFATGEVYVLAYADGGLTFTESKLSKADLFGMKSSAGEAEINSAILARIENGLYDSVLKSDQNKNLDSLLFLVTDTLLLGDTLNLFVLPDSASDFFGFRWRTVPPADMRFEPSVYQIEWVPTRDHIGIVDASYELSVRVTEELLSSEDNYGDTHHMHPVLQVIDSSLVILVSDTIVPPQPFVLVPSRFHRINISTMDIDENDRFVFEGETPFSTNSINTNGVISIGVSADLSTIKHNKTSAFNFKSSSDKPDSIVTLSFIHDLDSNLFYMSIFPPRDTIPQSFDPEGLSPDLFKFPEYFFEGFPSTLGLEPAPNGGLNILTSGQNISGVISLSSPLHSQDHDLMLSYYGGRPYAVRGDINVKENGSQKTITEIDFESSFMPLLIDAWLTPASRDTFVFHLDSIPDTLKTKTDFHSFYAPATLLNEKRSTGGGVTGDSPSAVKVETGPPELEILTVDSTVIQINSSDSAVTVSADSIRTSGETLSIVPLGATPISPDSIEADILISPPDST